MLEFFETRDHNGLKGFYEQNGLEVSENIEVSDGAIYSIEAKANGKTLAAATLSYRSGVYILDYIAVDKALRRTGVGSAAVRLTAEKAKALGAERLYLTARKPRFFEKLGFIEGSPPDVDMNADCIGCPQFQNGCVKLPMYLTIK